MNDPRSNPRERLPWRAVLSDIDGTLVGPSKHVSEQTVRAVRELVRQGVLFALVTGRMPGGVDTILAALGVSVPRVCYSGALVLDANGAIVHQSCLEPALARGVLDVIEREFFQLSPCFFAGLDWYVQDARNNAVVRESTIVESTPTEARFDELLARGILPNKLFCSCSDHLDLSAPLAARLKAEFHGVSVIRSTNGVMVEIIPAGTSKATGARRLLEAHGIDPAHTVAYGDDENDVPMLSMVGMGVAMGNAAARVKDAARDSTLTAQEDGVAHHLQRLGLVCP